MACAWRLLLMISLFTAGINLHSSKTLNRILGRSLHLSLEPTDRNMTRIDKVQVKKVLRNGSKRTIFSFDVASRVCSFQGEDLQNCSRFHPENLSLDFSEITREDAGSYVLVWHEKFIEKEAHLQLDVYEQISASSIPVTKMLENETCTMLLNCTVEKGDNVTYNWTQSHGNVTRQLTHNDSILTITPAPGDTSLSYACLAKNPVSQSYHDYSPWTECYPSAFPSDAASFIHLAFLSFIVFALVIGGFILWWRYKQRQMARSNLCLTEDTHPERSNQGRTEVVNTAEIYTIYSAVQKPVPTNNVVQAAENQESLTVYELAWPPQESCALTSTTQLYNYNSCRPGGPGPKESPFSGPNT
uniref:Signaling lymphocytic activation molecule-like isoform X2 n=1 Tax=Geotrypetes seraphini TaxID=260995 RepID=A0A6P8PXK7_GEOSA|nr:signaling lymphocytic activation molecule-like isoform X2 [Geotrypetes seraphini]